MVQKNVTRTPVYAALGAMGAFAFVGAGVALGYGLTNGTTDVSLTGGPETTTVVITESAEAPQEKKPTTDVRGSEDGRDSSATTDQSAPAEPTQSTPNNPTGRGLSAPTASPDSGGAEPTARTNGANGTIVDDYYVVAPGDTLSAISGRVGISVDHLVAWNGISNPNLIYANSALELHP